MALSQTHTAYTRVPPNNWRVYIPYETDYIMAHMATETYLRKKQRKGTSTLTNGKGFKELVPEPGPKKKHFAKQEGATSKEKL